MAVRLAALAAAIAVALAAATARAEHDWFLVGDGGTTPVISSTGTVLNDYAQVPMAVNVAATTIPVTAASVYSPGGFAPGKLVMLIQVTGTTLTLNSGAQTAIDLAADLTGRFELGRIAS